MAGVDFLLASVTDGIGWAALLFSTTILNSDTADMVDDSTDKHHPVRWIAGFSRGYNRGYNIGDAYHLGVSRSDNIL